MAQNNFQWHFVLKKVANFQAAQNRLASGNVCLYDYPSLKRHDAAPHYYVVSTNFAFIF